MRCYVEQQLEVMIDHANLKGISDASNIFYISQFHSLHMLLGLDYAHGDRKIN